MTSSYGILTMLDELVRRFQASPDVVPSEEDVLQMLDFLFAEDNHSKTLDAAIEARFT